MTQKKIAKKCEFINNQINISNIVFSNNAHNCANKEFYNKAIKKFYNNENTFFTSDLIPSYLRLGSGAMLIYEDKNNKQYLALCLRNESAIRQNCKLDIFAGVLDNNLSIVENVYVEGFGETSIKTVDNKQIYTIVDDEDFIISINVLPFIQNEIFKSNIILGDKVEFVYAEPLNLKNSVRVNVKDNKNYSFNAIPSFEVNTSGFDFSMVFKVKIPYTIEDVIFQDTERFGEEYGHRETILIPLNNNDNVRIFKDGKLNKSLSYNDFIERQKKLINDFLKIGIIVKDVNYLATPKVRILLKNLDINNLNELIYEQSMN